jgi:hypothetical protein
MPRRTLLALAVGAFVVSAIVEFGCGGSRNPAPARSPTLPSAPTAPTPPSGPAEPIPNLAGGWAGTIESPAFATRPITMLLTQTSITCVDDAWGTVPAEWGGAISGFAFPGSFSGFISFEGPPRASGLCPGVHTASGSAIDRAISGRWTTMGTVPAGARRR